MHLRRLLPSLLLALVFSSQATLAQQTSPTTKVFGGKDVPSNTWRWVTGVLDTSRSNIYSSQICGGSLIAPDWVLTAAHCVEPFFAADLNVLLDTVFLSYTDPPTAGTNPLIIGLDAIAVYPQRSSSIDNDYALLQLSSSATGIPTVSIIDQTLFNDLESTANNMDEVIVAGWGQISSTGDTLTDYPQDLQSVRLDYMDWQACKDIYTTDLTENMICAVETNASATEPDDTGDPTDPTPADTTGEDTCNGDSGGPLFTDGAYEHQLNVQWLVGLTSWGQQNGCGDANYPGVYAEILPVIDWIEQKTSDAGLPLVDVSTHISSNPDTLAPGGVTTTLSLSVHNDSLSNLAQSITTTITYPADLSLSVQASDMTCMEKSSTETECTAASIAAQNQLDTSFTVSWAGGEGDVTVTATTTQQEGDYRSANNERQTIIHYTSGVDLATTLSATNTSSSPNGTLPITLTVANNSAVNNATGIETQITYPDSLTLTPSGTDMTCNTQAGPKQVCTAAGLNAQQQLQMSFDVTHINTPEVITTLSADTTSIEAEIDNSDNSTGLDLAFTNKPDPAITNLEGIQTDAANGTFKGNVVVQTENLSDHVTADNVVVTLDLDPQLNITSTNCDSNNNQLTCALGNLAPGATEQILVGVSSTNAASYSLEADITNDNGDAYPSMPVTAQLVFSGDPGSKLQTAVSSSFLLLDSDDDSGAMPPFLFLLLFSLIVLRKANHRLEQQKH